CGGVGQGDEPRSLRPRLISAEKVHLRRNREVEQGGQIRRHEAGLIRGTSSGIFRNSRSANPARIADPLELMGPAEAREKVQKPPMLVRRYMLPLWVDCAGPT